MWILFGTEQAIQTRITNVLNAEQLTHNTHCEILRLLSPHENAVVPTERYGSPNEQKYFEFEINRFKYLIGKLMP